MDTSVAEAMRAVPREHFLPRGQQRSADLDQALEVGHGQTCSQPSTVVDMLQLLDVRPDMRVLDVGSGTGWTTALVERGRENLAGEGMRWTRIEGAEQGKLGRPENAPYDRILVSAMSDDLPGELVE